MIRRVLLPARARCDRNLLRNAVCPQYCSNVFTERTSVSLQRLLAGEIPTSVCWTTVMIVRRDSFLLACACAILVDSFKQLTAAQQK